MSAPARITDIPPPFTIPKLAERWECSEGLIRKMIDRGELNSFRIGILFRIPAEEVARIECQNLTACSDSGATSPSSIETSAANESEAGSTPKIGRARKPKPVGGGPGATIHHGPWVGS
jgi:excisionase family DNA binding protein